MSAAILLAFWCLLFVQLDVKPCSMLTQSVVRQYRTQVNRTAVTILNDSCVVYLL